MLNLWYPFFTPSPHAATELPLNFLTPMSDVQVYEKDDAKFEVEVSRVPKSFRWLKGSQELQSDDKYEILQEGKIFALVIRSAAYDDEAKYMFEAEDKRTAGKLVIQGKKKIILKSSPQLYKKCSYSCLITVL